ncbi:hypothetical protein [Paracoccus sediminilitoris]|uniref:hypothetical protein n=1 Tax=Paracoccus sediminilitoris TaxID=2202419 RepID=UPI002729FBD0|nr:hypothetical protein [Paracoccus sediminilitoris]
MATSDAAMLMFGNRHDGPHDQHRMQEQFLSPQRRAAKLGGNGTNADQKARHPGDRGFERLALYAYGYETG